MGAEPNIDKLGPLALPVGLILSILTLILAVTKIISEVGLKVAAVISFLVLLGWSIWTEKVAGNSSATSSWGAWPLRLCVLS
jgi:hypothetical protein